MAYWPCDIYCASHGIFAKGKYEDIKARRYVIALECDRGTDLMSHYA